jgi:hypothetical protein
LADRAGIKTHGIFRWHIGRKLFLRTCAELGINTWNAKIMVGKSIPADIMTYINGVQLKDDFLRVANVLELFPKIIPEAEDKIRDLEMALKHVEKENRIAKTRIDYLQKDIEEMDGKINETISKRVGDAMKAMVKMLNSQGIQATYDEHPENCNCEECKSQTS